MSIEPRFGKIPIEISNASPRSRRWQIRPDPRSGKGIPRKIKGFQKDDEGQWTAVLECGHTQHVRHKPPWQNRPWVVTEQGRQKFIGTELMCLKCV